MKYQYKNFQQLMLLRLVRLQRYSHEEAGFVLVIVISMVLILTSLLAAYGLLSKIETASVKSFAKSDTGFYAAEAGLNLRAKQIRDKFEGYNRPSGTKPSSWENCLDNSTTNDGDGNFACISRIFFDGKPNEQKVLSYVEEEPKNPFSIRIGDGEDFAGLNAQEYRFTVTSVAVNSQDLLTARLGLRFKSRLVPLFQFVVFYNNDAEFTNPPSMTLNGPIHSNSDLYLNSADTLTIDGLISTVGKLYRGEKASSSCGGTVRIYTIQQDPNTAKNLSCSGDRKAYSQSEVSDWKDRIRVGIPKLVVPAPDELDPTPGKLYWDKADLRVVLKLDSITSLPSGIEIRKQDNSVDTTKTTALLNSCPSNTAATTTLTANALNGGTTLNVNSTNGFTAMAPGVIGDAVRVGTDYDSNIITNVNAAAKTITLRRQLGSTASTGATVSKVSVWTSDTFYNYREKNASPPVASDGTAIRMLNVDVQGLLDCIQSQNLMASKTLNDDTDGGLVWFLTVDGPNSKTDVNSGTAPNTRNNYAVRLYNGKYLYSGQSGAPEIKGLTIVSDQAVYVQGEYNLKDNPATLLINEGDNPLTLTVTEKWRPASILADTINILSNNWKLDDSNGRAYVGNLPTTTNTYTSRIPTPTSINAAFLSGTTITGGVNGTSGQGGVNSGGINNYPRFHEHWNSSIPFNYKGSFVSLNAPRRTNSQFCGSALPTTCNIYTPPVRNWDFDTDFNNAANIPPLAPQAVYLIQEEFSRKFEQ